MKGFKACLHVILTQHDEQYFQLPSTVMAVLIVIILFLPDSTIIVFSLCIMVYLLTSTSKSACAV